MKKKLFHCPETITHWACCFFHPLGLMKVTSGSGTLYSGRKRSNERTYLHPGSVTASQMVGGWPSLVQMWGTTPAGGHRCSQAHAALRWIMPGPQCGLCCIPKTGRGRAGGGGVFWGCQLSLGPLADGFCPLSLPCVGRHVWLASQQCLSVLFAVILLSTAKNGDAWTESSLVIWVR